MLVGHALKYLGHVASDQEARSLCLSGRVRHGKERLSYHDQWPEPNAEPRVIMVGKFDVAFVDDLEPHRRIS